MEEIARVFGINWKLLLVQAVNFGVLLLALWYFLYTPILKMIDARREKIEQGVKDAEEAEQRLHEVEKESDEVLSEARQSAGEILAHSKERAEQQSAEIVNEASSRADSIVEGAQKRADEAQRQALRESEAEISKAAILAAEKILKDK